MQLLVPLTQVLKFCSKTHFYSPMKPPCWHLCWLSSFVQVCSQSCSLSPEAGVYGSPELVLTLWFSVSSANEELPSGYQRKGELCHSFSPQVHSPRMLPWCVCVACYCFQGHLTMQKSLFFHLFLPSSIQI